MLGPVTPHTNLNFIWKPRHNTVVGLLSIVVMLSFHYFCPVKPEWWDTLTQYMKLCQGINTYVFPFYFEIVLKYTFKSYTSTTQKVNSKVSDVRLQVINWSYHIKKLGFSATFWAECWYLYFIVLRLWSYHVVILSIFSPTMQFIWS